MSINSPKPPQTVKSNSENYPGQPISPTWFLRSALDHAIKAALPTYQMAAFIPPPPPQPGRVIVIGAGKASSSMALAVEQFWREKNYDFAQLSGVMVTRHGQKLPTERIDIIEAAHPVPDEASIAASRRILQQLQGVTQHDVVLCLISGGGSALMCLPAAGVTLQDKQNLNRALLQSGASISEMNVVRKHVSAIKGGRLAVAAQPARLVTLMISDVPNDDPAIIASGPTLPDPTFHQDARAIIDRYKIALSPALAECLARKGDETPKQDHPAFANSVAKIVISPQASLEAAANFARHYGVTPLILSSNMEGESRDVARVHAAIARQIRHYRQPIAPPCLILSGGETSVTLRGKGRGGRNSEFILAMLNDLKDSKGIYALAADTDGIDGTENNAGAIITPESWQCARDLGLKPADYLQNNDGWGFFNQIDGLVVTGATHTNVNDLRAVLITHADNSPPSKIFIS